jgi:hypothetical protein
MTAAGWIAIVVLAAALVWLGLALAGLVREQAALRARVEELESRSDPVSFAEGLPIGGQAPAWSITTADGDVVTSRSVAGRRHLVLFADADCLACEDVVPEVVRAAERGALPQAVIVGRGDPSSLPSSWRSVSAGVERGREVSEAFDVDVSPYVFVVDDGGGVVARGGVVDLRDVERLVAAGRDITIVREADG